MQKDFSMFISTLQELVLEEKTFTKIILKRPNETDPKGVVVKLLV